MTKILLVEDDKSLREIYGVRLLAEGYDIVSAGDGEEALAMAIKERPQLIVSDVMMPKISGFDMLDILRSTSETRDIKVIMMTALSSEDQRARGESLGADRYLVKSQVGIEDVVRTVHEVLGDAPSSAPNPAAQSYNMRVPSLAPRPAQPAVQAAPTVPPRPTPPIAPTAWSAQPPAPQQPPAASPSPMTVPSQNPTPPPPPAPSGLPQPTAPFSTPRPQNLADRIIHPITVNGPSPDLANRMAQELDTHNGQQAATPLPAPAGVPLPPQPPTPGIPNFQAQPLPPPSANPDQDPRSLNQ